MRAPFKNCSEVRNISPGSERREAKAVACSQIDHMKRNNLQPYTYSAKPLHYLQIVTYVDRGDQQTSEKKFTVQLLVFNYHIRHSSLPHLQCAFNLFSLQGLILLWGLLSLSVTSEVVNDISVSKDLKDKIGFFGLGFFFKHSS